MDYVSRIALEKNKAVKKKKSEIVLTADTVVALGRRIIQKPNNKEEALYFLNQLSGRRHKVYTCICIFSKENFIHISNLKLVNEQKKTKKTEAKK